MFALLGVVVERLLRQTGRLRCDPSGWQWRFTTARDGFGQLKQVEPGEAASEAKRVEYRFAIDLFNGKEVPTGLRDIKIVLTREDAESLTSRPYDLLSVQRDPSFDVMTKSDVDVLNLPPRQFVRKELAGSFDSQEAVEAFTAAKWVQVEFVAEFPKRPFFGILGSNTYRKTITDRGLVLSRTR